MSAAEKVNENYRHACGEKKLALEKCAASLSEMGYSFGDLGRVFDFYLLRAPVLKSGSKRVGTLRSLGAMGWHGRSGCASLPELERLLLLEAGMHSFFMIKGTRIDETLSRMDLGSSVCPVHPRAVMQMNAKLSITESGVMSAKATETRMECLFRHIRNALSHSLTYRLGDEALLLEDKAGSSAGVVSARIVLRRDTLLKWIDIVERV